MAQVRLDIGGRTYDVACRDGGEARLRVLARLVDARASDVTRAIGHGNETRELVMTALLLADDIEEAQAGEAARLTALEACADRLEAIAAAIETPR